MPPSLPQPAKPSLRATRKQPPVPALSLHAVRSGSAPRSQFHPEPDQPGQVAAHLAAVQVWLRTTGRAAFRRPVPLGLSLLLAAGMIGGLGAQSFAAGPSPDPVPPSNGLLPPTLTVPPINLPGLPPVALPPLTLPALPPLIGPSSALPAAASDLGAYRGLGAWVDLYHYGNAGDDAPARVVSSMASHGVRSIFIETARWNSPAALDHPGQLGGFIDAAHAAGLRVVGWYLPGFANIANDVQRSMAVLNFISPEGQHFDGYAADIEDRSATRTQAQFNAGIAAYAQALRQAVAPGAILGAIVPDAKNDLRAPAHWAGFPWPQIGDNFDVLLPMAYWSVTKITSTCRSTEMDVTGYINQVIDLTNSLTGRSRPIAPVGGIANCDTIREVGQYVSTLKARGALGGGLYDFYALEANPRSATLWSELAPLNG